MIRYMSTLTAGPPETETARRGAAPGGSAGFGEGEEIFPYAEQSPNARPFNTGAIIAYTVTADLMVSEVAYG